MPKIGMFLIMLGVFLLALYLLSDIAGAPKIGLIFSALVLLGLGFWIRSINRPEPKQKSERFQVVKRLENRKKRKSKDQKEGSSETKSKS